MKIGAPITTVSDIMNIAFSPGVRVSSSPFGIAGRRTWYIGRSVPWKMVKGIESIERINPRVASGLKRAISISQAHRERGVALVNIDGATKLMPLKSAKMSPRAIVLGTYRSSGEAISMLPGAPRVALAPSPPAPALPSPSPAGYPKRRISLR